MWHTRPRMRVVCDNDYSGDPDGLFQLAHHALSGSVDLAGVIGSHLRPGDPFDGSEVSAENAAAEAGIVLELAERPEVRIAPGSNTGLTDRRTPAPSPGLDLLLDTIARDGDLPLYVCCGAGLTTVASAWLTDPSISQRIEAVVWIGGPEYPGTDLPPGGLEIEYNVAIDPIAAQIVLDDSDLTVWQVPRNAYRETLTSVTELQHRLSGSAVGDHLLARLGRVEEFCAAHGRLLGEVYALGDSPLVLLTALQSSFQPAPSSSPSRSLPAPVLDDAGRDTGEALPDRLIRVFSGLDVDLMLRDMYAKLG